MCDWVDLPRHSCRDCGIQSNAIGISSGLAHPPFCDLVFKHGIETKVDPVSVRVNVCSCLSTVIFIHGQFALEIILVVGIKDVQLMNGFKVLQNFLLSAHFLVQSSKMTFWQSFSSCWQVSYVSSDNFPSPLYAVSIYCKLV